MFPKNRKLCVFQRITRIFSIAPIVVDYNVTSILGTIRRIRDNFLQIFLTIRHSQQAQGTEFIAIGPGSGIILRVVKVQQKVDD